MRKYLFLTILLLCLSLGVRGQIVYPTIDLSGLPKATTAQSLRYWFDDDIGTNVQTSNVLDGSSVTISATSLVDGIHILHYQIVDSKGIAGIPVSKFFIKVGAILTATKLLYWFDDEKSGATETALSNDVMTVDASALVDGIHILHYQTVDSKGDAGIPVSKMFMKLGATVAAKATGIQYWFDDNDALMKESEIKNLSTTIDASGLAFGEHTLHYQLKLSDGTLSPTASSTFSTTQVLQGDANNDQKVNVADIVVIQIFIDDNTKPIHGANADADGNGVIDEEDVEDVSNIILGIKK